MSFRLVPNSVTLDDLERRNSPNRRVISPNSVAFGADYEFGKQRCRKRSVAEFMQESIVFYSVCTNTIQYNSVICKGPLYSLSRSRSANRTMQTTQ